MFGYQGYDIVGESLLMCEEKFNKDKYHLNIKINITHLLTLIYCAWFQDSYEISIS